MRYTDWHYAVESALEVARDALERRARVLDGQDPEVAKALRLLVSKLGPHSFRDWWVKKGKAE